MALSSALKQTPSSSVLAPFYYVLWSTKRMIVCTQVSLYNQVYKTVWIVEDIYDIINQTSFR